MKTAHQAFVLVGPTAVGKSAAAEQLASSEHLPILSADSMLVYRGMDIGTAKPAVAARARYFGIDLADPHQTFSVGDYLARVREQMASVPKLIVAGGTGLYVKCLVEGLRDVPTADDAWRREAEEILSTRGIAALQEDVRKRAPAQYAALRDPQNPRRLIRAAEQALAEKSGPAFAQGPRPTIVGLRRPAAALDERIRRRVGLMYDEGLLDEAERLSRRVPEWSETARQAIGYAEALTVIAGQCTVNAAKEKTILRTRQLAKRQMTWFRNQADVDWIDVPPDAPPETIAAEVLSRWKQHGPIALAI